MFFLKPLSSVAEKLSYIAAAAKSLQSCLTLHDPSLPGSSAHWIFQAGVLEWVAIAFSKLLYTYTYKYVIEQGARDWGPLQGWVQV